ncbi:GDSL esterase/lipase CPRD49 [Rhynchospora pubera]|uniref:GDSL esterase/lipase CPRD49 n=1 Tax=Rhynchospora pubera TaxID=906938 RepID=A0AAV8D225_9POAL|nr:GDSL esterase/lipase CPRD49 [Rhynchospora pubera]
MTGPVRPVIVLFGSSIVQYSFGNGGWGAKLADIYSRQADVVLRGYEGWNSMQACQVLATVFPEDAVVQPSLVIVYFGGNDSCTPLPDGWSPHVDLPEYVENMRRIGLHIRNLSETTRVIFLSCPPVNENMLEEPALRTYEACRDYSNACIEMCDELSHTDPSFRVIDLFNAIQQHHDWAHTLLVDGVHFSPVASDIVAAEIVRVINEADWEPSLSVGDLPTEFEEVVYPIQPIDPTIV